MRKVGPVVLTRVAAAVFPVLVPAQSTSTSATSPAVVGADQQFITQAGQSGLFEVQLGQLAEQRARDGAVKQLAQQLVADHSQINGELAGYAARGHFIVPQSIAADKKVQYDKLAKLSGKRFDKAFTLTTIQEHQAASAMFRQAEGTVGKPLKVLIAKTLPILSQHLSTAQQLAATHKYTKS
jgi:putative membrane protein